MKIFLILYLIYYLIAKYLGIYYDADSTVISDININWLIISVPLLITYLIDKIYAIFTLNIASKVKDLSILCTDEEENKNTSDKKIDELEKKIDERLTKLEKSHNSMYTFVASALKANKRDDDDID